MSVLTFINEEYVGYNLMLTIKIDDPISGSPASTYDIQQSFRLANSGMNVSKTSPKIVDDLSINSIDYPEGTQVRAEYMGKYGLCSADVSDSYRNLMTAAPFQITLTYM